MANLNDKYSVIAFLRSMIYFVLFSVRGDWRLVRHLSKVHGTLESRLKSAVDPKAFMQEVCSLFDNIKASKTGTPFHGVVDDSPLYQRLVEEVETLGWEM